MPKLLRIKHAALLEGRRRILGIGWKGVVYAIASCGADGKMVACDRNMALQERYHTLVT